MSFFFKTLEKTALYVRINKQLCKSRLKWIFNFRRSNWDSLSTSWQLSHMSQSELFPGLEEILPVTKVVICPLSLPFAVPGTFTSKAISMCSWLNTISAVNILRKAALSSRLKEIFRAISGFQRADLSCLLPSYCLPSPSAEGRGFWGDTKLCRANINHMSQTSPNPNPSCSPSSPRQNFPLILCWKSGVCRILSKLPLVFFLFSVHVRADRPWLGEGISTFKKFYCI